MDQMKETKNGERFLCFAYEPNDPSINKKKVLQDMDKYWMEQNRKYLAQKKESQQKNNNSYIEKNRITIKGQFSWREVRLYHHMK